jgi:hypothetical protein
MAKRPPATLHVCAFCGDAIRRGQHWRTVDGGGRMHSQCKVEARRRGQILSGETYRGQRPSDWRR